MYICCAGMTQGWVNYSWHTPLYYKRETYGKKNSWVWERETLLLSRPACTGTVNTKTHTVQPLSQHEIKMYFHNTHSWSFSANTQHLRNCSEAKLDDNKSSFNCPFL